MIIMLKHIKKALLFAAAGAIAVSMLASCGTVSEKTSEQAAANVPAVTGEFKTTVLKCGKADAIILESADSTIVIDCGETSDGDKVAEYLTSQGKTSIDYLFITHFDQDHVGGAAEVIENIEVGEIITPDYQGSNSEYTSFITAAANKGYGITRLTENMTLTLGDVLYEIYPPLKSSYTESDNDYSIVIKATHGTDTFLFAGDAEAERLKELYTQIGDLSADFLKVPHHGRIDDESETFINAVKPKYAVITCSKKEGGEEKLLALLDAAGSETYLTTGGTVTAVSTGSGITVTQAAE